MHEIGYVYLLNNSETGHWKVGCTERPIAQRIGELNGVGSGLIGRWELSERYIVELSEMRGIEQGAHRVLTNLGLRVRLDREVFRGTLYQCQSAILESLEAYPKSMRIYSLNRLADDPASDRGLTESSFRRVEYRFSRVPGNFFFRVHRVQLGDDGRIEGIDMRPHGYDTSNSHSNYLCDAYRGFTAAWTNPPVMWVDLFTHEADGLFGSCGLLGEEWGRISFYSPENPYKPGDGELHKQADEAWQEYRYQLEALTAKGFTRDEHARIALTVAPANFERVSAIAQSAISKTPFMSGFHYPYRSTYK